MIMLISMISTKRYVALDNDDKRVNINVQPILSPTGDAVIGALYVKSNIEQKYSEINNTAVIFLYCLTNCGIYFNDRICFSCSFDYTADR